MEDILKALQTPYYYVEVEEDVERDGEHGDIYITAGKGELSATYRSTNGSFDIDNWKITTPARRDQKPIDSNEILSIMSMFVPKDVIDEIARVNHIAGDEQPSRHSRFGSYKGRYAH